MKRTLLYAAAAAIVATCTIPVVAAAATTEPTCLVSESSTTGSIGNNVTCAELFNANSAPVAHGSVRTSSTVSFTISVQFRPALDLTGDYQTLASRTVTGSGMLDTYTDPAFVPGLGWVRACAEVVAPGTSQPYQVCTAPVVR